MLKKTTVPIATLCLQALMVLALALPAIGAPPLDSEQARAIAFDYLEANRSELGLSANDLADVVVNDQYVSRHTGTTHIYLLQRLGGVEVHNGILNLAIGPDGKIIHVGQRFVSNLARKVSGTPALSAIEAIDRAAAELELSAPAGVQVLEAGVGSNQRSLLTGGGVSLENIPARLVYQTIANGQVRLAWDLVIHELDHTDWWNVRIDAESGRMLDKNNFVANEQYSVYPIPIESPIHSAMPPPVDARTIAVDPFMDSPASPFGWHDTNGVAGPEFTITRGNNVHAYADANNDNIPDGGANAEPDGGAGLDFTGAVVPIDFTMSPTTFTQASISNLFYWSNIIHDVLSGYGFDEASGNFQVTNYSGNGLGGDDVRAEAQNGFNCNATFGTPADGMRPLMSMFICPTANPDRDGSFDHGVVAHEYGHGVSNRLTGGPAAAGCLGNPEQMGEGWSDYIGMMLTMEAGDTGPDARGVGTYLFGQAANGPGIRNAPYSTDFGVNNFTYGNIPGVSVPHGVGHVWATMLWDVTWNLIDEYGLNPNIYDDWTTGGNNLAMQLVMDGMKLQPCGPGFVDGRDGVLAADDALTGTGGFFTGVNQCAIWDGFAIRGLGFSSDQGDPNSRSDGTEAFDMPPACETIGAPIGLQNICQGDTAQFRIGAGTMFSAPPVTLSSAGQPAGTAATFTPSVLATVPGVSDFAISGTGAVPPGSYAITVTGADTGANTFNADVELNVFDVAPVAGPGLTLPANGAVDEPISPTFTWTAVASALSYTLEIDDDPAFGSIDYTASGIEGLSHTPTIELDFLTTYSWRVRGDNPCGSGSNSAVFSFTVLRFPGDCDEGVTPMNLYLDDLETGAPDWTSSGTGDTWGLSNVRSNSPITSYAAVDPVTLSDQRLLSPPIVLPVGEALTLQFSNYQAFETPNSDGRCWDAGILEVTTDAGANFSQVPQSALLTDPYDAVIWNDTPGNNPITNDYGATDAWCNELQPFTAAVVDLSTWAGETVQFRWRLGSDSAAGNEGWYIDDVKVQSCGANSALFADSFESGDTSAWSATIP